MPASCPAEQPGNSTRPLRSAFGRTCALWHGDVAQTAKSRILRDPPDILLTTPESIEAILVSTRVSAAAFFSRIRFVVLDELDAFTADDRGWHVWYLLQRLARLVEQPFQILGLSATVGNPAELLSWVCAYSSRKQMVVSPELVPSATIPEINIDLVGSLENAAHVISLLHHGEKRLVFCDSRSQAEQLASQLQEKNIETFVSHSSLSKDERSRAETAFAQARNCVIVATSTLELGIASAISIALFKSMRPRRWLRFYNGWEGPAGEPHQTEIVYLWEKGWVEPVKPPASPHHVRI